MDILKKRIRAKRLLALVLAAAMITTTIPQSAYAAGQGEVTEVVSEYDTTDANSSGEENNTDAVASEDENADIPTGDDSGATTITMKGKIALDYSNFKAYGNYYGINYDQYDDVFYFSYNPSASTNVFTNYVNYMFSDHAFYITDTENMSDDEMSILYNDLKCTWTKQDAAGNYVAFEEGEYPKNAGYYKLTVSSDASYADITPLELIFRVDKNTITMEMNEYYAFLVTHGDTVKSYIDALNAGKVSVYVSGAYASDESLYVENVKYAVKYAADDNSKVLADTETFDRTKDYSLVISADPVDATNYIVETKVQKIYFNGYYATDFNFSYVQGKAYIERTYNGKAIAVPEKGTEYEYSLTRTIDGKTETVTPSEKEITANWYDVNHYVSGDFENSVPMSSAPVDAGTYYYVLRYIDSKGINDSCYCEIKVNVIPASITIKPTTDEKAVYYEGMDAYDVIRNVDYKVLDSTGKEFQIDKTTFFGVAGDYSTDSPMYYEPVFIVQKRNIQNDGTEGAWTDLALNAFLENTVAADEDGDKTEYRIIFSGKKATYKDGIPVDATITDITETGTQGAEKNYKVDCSDLAKYAIPVSVKQPANATIDVTGMLIGTKGNTIDNRYTKVYDGQGIYANREEYKKALVKDSQNKVIAQTTSEELVYTWYKVTIGDVAVLDDKGNPILDEEGKVVTKKAVVAKVELDTEYAKLPQEAGTYMLEVSYYDDNKAYDAEPAYLYYEIEKQLVVVKMKGDLQEWSGNDIYAEDLLIQDGFDYDIYKVPNNDIEKFEASEANKLKIANKRYYNYQGFNFYVEYVEDISAETPKYIKANTGDKYTTAGIYRLNVSLDMTSMYYIFDDYTQSEISNNFTNYKIVDDNSVQINDTLPINVNKMGDTEIRIDVNQELLDTVELTKTYDGKGFDFTELINQGLFTVTNLQDGSVLTTTGENPDITLEFYYRSPMYSSDGALITYSSKGMVTGRNVGYHSLIAYFSGNETYKSNYAEISNLIINKRTLQVMPNLKSDIYAGFYTDSSSEDYDGDYLYANQRVVVSGYLPEDRFYFETYYESVPYAFENVNVRVKRGASYFNGHLRYGVNYEAVVTNVEWDENYYYSNAFYNYNYEMCKAEFSPNKRALSFVGAPDVEYTDTTNSDTLTHTIKPEAAIPYYYDDDGWDDIDGNSLIGNYFILYLCWPDEYEDESYSSKKNRVVFKNSIEKAGGVIIDVDVDCITAAFEADGKDKNFDIVWEDGYVEHFNVELKNAEVFSDLDEAVAPKSLKFNGVSTKMVVGQVQHLDVSLKKKESRDIVELRYKVISGEDVASVTEDGVLTAAKKGTVTVEVYPVKRNKKGEIERIQFAAVTTKITVNDVDTVKIKGVVAGDYFATIKYAIPANGFRREIYVMEGSNISAATFESNIASMVRGEQNSIYTYFYPINESYGVDTKNVKTYTISYLAPNTTYSIYVRNVSALKELENGNMVALSAKGSVIKVTTTKCQLEELYAYFDNSYYQNDTIQWNSRYYRYEISLSKKSLQLSAKGLFAMEAGWEAADYYDAIWLQVPLSKENQENYQTPKLSYYAIDPSVPSLPVSDPDEKVPSGYVKIDDTYYGLSKIAGISKTGKITLKGIGSVKFFVIDERTGEYDYTGTYYITSDVTGLSVKNLSVTVGDYVNIYDIVTYLSNGKKLTSQSDNIASFLPVSVEILSGGDAIELYDNELFALRSNNKCEVRVSLLSNPSVSTTFVITTKAMPSVAGLKVYDKYDTEAYVSFTMPIVPSEFKIELKDSRGRILESSFENGVSLIDDYDGKNFIYKTSFDGLIRKSKYSVSITPYGFYRNESAKAKSMSFTTTDVVASYQNGLDDKKLVGGESIKIVNTMNNYYLGSARYLTSGNTYTLSVETSNINNKTCKDTLIWESSNKKVATVKANTGSYTATFKAVKTGSTYITVKSKLTKHIIARYYVNIKAVASGDSSFADYDYFDRYLDLTQEDGIQLLTVQNPVKTTNQCIIKFVAPEDGYYTFTNVNTNWIAHELDREKAEWEYNYSNPIQLTKGETVYFSSYINSTVRVSASYIQTVGIGRFEKSNVSKSYKFVAPSEGYYAIYKIEKGAKTYVGSIQYMNTGDTRSISVPANQEYGIEKLNDIAATTSVAAKSQSMLVFTAKETGFYTFTKPTADPSAKVEYSTNSGSSWTDWPEAATSIALAEVDPVLGAMADSLTLGVQAGRTIIFRVTNESDKEITGMTMSATDNMVIIEPDAEAQIISLTKNDVSYFKFVIPDNSVSYELSVGQVKANETDADISIDVQIVSETGNTEFTYGTINDGKLHTYTLSGSSLEQNTDYYAMISGSSYNTGDKVSIQLKKITQTALTEGVATEMDLKKDSRYYSFVAPRYGRYVFETQSIGTDYVSVEAEYSFYENDLGYYMNSISSYPNRTSDERFEMTLEKGQKVFFLVNTTTSTTPDGVAAPTSKVVVKEIKPSALEQAKYISTDSLVGEYSYYVFTADSGAEYNTVLEKASNVNVSYSYSLYSSYWYTLYTGNHYSLDAGEKLYIRVNNTDGAIGTEESDNSGKFKLSFDNISVTELPSSIIMDEDGTKTFTYKYTVLEAARYTLNFKMAEGASETASVSVKVGGNYYNSSNGQEYVYTTVGQQVEVKVTLSNAKKDDKAEITFTKVVAKHLPTTEEEITLKPGESNWYFFEAGASGRYSFKSMSRLVPGEGEAETKLSKNSYEVYTYVDLTKTDYDYLSDAEMNWFEKGDSFYVKVTNNYTKDMKYVLNASLVNGTEITLGNELTIPEIEAGEVTYLKFVAPKSDYYKLNDDSTTNDFGYEYYLNTTDDYCYSISKGENLNLAKGDTLLIVVTNNSSEKKSTKVTISNATVYKLEAGKELNITGAKKDETIYLEYLYPTNGESEVYIKNVPEHVNFLYDGNLYGLYSVIGGDQGETVLLALTPTADSEYTEETISFSVKAKSFTFNDVDFGDNSVKLNKTERYHFNFTAKADGWYYLKKEATGAEPVIDDVYAYYNDSYYPESVYPLSEGNAIFLEEGESVKGMLYYDGKEAPSQLDVKFTVVRVVPTAISNGEVEVEIKEDEGKWYSFTATEAGYYTFANDYLYTEIYESASSDYIIEEGDKFTIAMKAGSTVAILLYNSGSDYTGKYTVVKEASTAITADDTKTVAATKANSYTYYTFTAPVDGSYSFVAERENSAYAYGGIKICTSEDENSKYANFSYSNFASISNVKISKGQTYLVRLEHEYVGEYKLTVKTVSEKVHNDGLKTTKYDTNSYLCTFTAPATGKYEFAFSSKLGGYSYVYYGNNEITEDNYSGYNYFTVSNGNTGTRTLLEGEKVVVRMYSNYATSSKPDTLEMNISKFVSSKIIGTENPNSSLVTLAFEVPETGKYTFTNISNIYGYAYYFGTDSSFSYQDTSIGKGSYFNRYLLEGSTVYFRTTNNGYTGNIFIQVEKESTEGLKTLTTKASSLDDAEMQYFTVEQDGMYSFMNVGSSSKESNSTIYLYASETSSSYYSSANRNYTTGRRVYEAGDKVYFKVINTYASESAPITVFIKPVRTDMGNIIKKELTSDEAQYVEFTPEKAGYYKFTNYTSDTYVYFQGANKDKSNNQVSSSGNSYPLMGGQKVYIKLVNSSATESNPAKAYVGWTLDDSRNFVDAKAVVAKNETGKKYQVISWTAEESGTYTFYNATRASSTIYLVGTSEVSDCDSLPSYNTYINNGNSVLGKYIKAGTTVYFLAYSSLASAEDEINITFAVEKTSDYVPNYVYADVTLESSKEITLGYNENGNNIYNYFSFKATEDGLYSFDIKTEDSNGYNSLYVYGDYYQTFSVLNSRYGYGNINTKLFLKAGQTVYVKLYGYDNYGESATYPATFCISKAAEVSETLTSSTAKSVTYTIPSDGVYNFFRSSNVTVRYRGVKTGSSYQTNVSLYDYTSSGSSYVLPKDAVVTFEITANTASEENPVTGTVYVQKLPNDKIFSKKVSSNSSTSYKLVSVSVDDLDVYQLSVVGSAYVYYYGSSEPDDDGKLTDGYIKYTSSGSLNCLIEPGQEKKAYFKVRVNVAEEGSSEDAWLVFKPTNEDLSAEDATEIGTEAVAVSLNRDDKYYKFTAGSAGVYEFSTDEIVVPDFENATGSTYCYISVQAYSDNYFSYYSNTKGDSTSASAGGSINYLYKLKAGETIYFKVSGSVYYYSDEGTKYPDAEFSIKVEKSDSASKTLTSSETQEVKYTVPADGEYEFFISSGISATYRGVKGEATDNLNTLGSSSNYYYLPKDAVVSFDITASEASEENPVEGTIYVQKKENDKLVTKKVSSDSSSTYKLVSITADVADAYDVTVLGDAAVYYYGSLAPEDDGKLTSDYIDSNYYGSFNCLIDSGDENKVYFKVKANLTTEGSSEDVWVILKPNGIALTAVDATAIENEAVAVAVNEQSEKFYKYTAASAGVYEFSTDEITVPDFVYATGSKYCYISMQAYSDKYCSPSYSTRKGNEKSAYAGGKFNHFYKLKAGETIYIKMTGDVYYYSDEGKKYPDAEFNLKIEKLDSPSKTLTSSETQKVTYTVPFDGEYKFFRSNEITAYYYGLKQENPYSLYTVDNGSSQTYYLPKDAVITFSISANTASEENPIEGTIYVQKKENDRLVTKKVSSDSKSIYKLVSVSVDNLDVYNVRRLGDANVYYYGSVAPADDGALTSGYLASITNNTYNCPIEPGDEKKVYFKVKVNVSTEGNSEDIWLVLMPTGTELTAVNADTIGSETTSVSISRDENQKYVYNYYKFTAPEDGTYKLTTSAISAPDFDGITNTKYCRVYVDAYSDKYTYSGKGSSTSAGEGSSITRTYSMRAGETIYIRFYGYAYYNNSGIVECSAEFDVSISKTE